MKKQRILIAGMLLASASLFAGCQINFNSIRYNVDFYVDGELYKSVGTDGKTIEMPANPTKEGYQFGGWYTEENGEGELITLYTLFNQPLSEDIRLSIHAHFLEELTVSFVTGTDEVISDAIYLEGDTVSALSPTITPEDMLFNGWFVDEECTIKWDKERELTDDVTLYAGWLTKTVTITYVYNMEGMENTTVAVNRFEVATPEKPADREDAKFAGWHTDTALKDAWDFTKTVDEDLTVYAKWDSKFVTVTYNYGKEGMENTTAKVSKGEKVEEIIPADTEDAKFIGWYKNQSLTTPWDFNKTIDTNLTLYAKWENKYVNVTYNFNHESFENITVKIENGATAEEIVPDHIPPYHDFLGWHRYEYGYSDWDFSTPITRDTTIYAVWDDHTGEYVHVTYVDPDGYNYYSDTRIGDLIEPREPILEQGIRLVGWYLDQAFTMPWDFENDRADKNEITLYAKTERIAYTITIDAQGYGNFAPITVYYGDTVTLPELFKDDYYLSAWVSSKRTVHRYNNSFSYVHNQETDLTFTPEFSSIYTFELNYFDQTYTLSQINHLLQDVVSIPATYKGLPVTEIDEQACRNVNQLKKLIIPDSVTRIRQEAFEACYNLTEVTFGSGLTTIDANVFADCRALKTVNFTGNNLKTIGTDVFFGTAIERLVLPDSVETLGSMGYLRQLTYIDLGNVKTLKGGFQGCTALKEVRLPATLETIETTLFYDCNLIIYAEAVSKPDGWVEDWNEQNLPVVWDANNTKATMVNNMLFITKGEEAMLVHYKGTQTAVTVPESVTIDGKTYPVTEFGANAFYSLTSLRNITLPNTLEKVNVPQFIGCTSLQYHVENGVAYLGTADNPRYLLKDLTANQKTLTIPAETRIVLGHGPNHPYTKYSISKLVFEKGSQLISLGPNFYYWSSADYLVYLPAGIKYISTGAFAYDYLHVFVPEETAPETWDKAWYCYNDKMHNPCVVHYGISEDDVVTLGEAVYLLKGEEAALMRLQCTGETFAIPESIEWNGVEYPVTAIEPDALTYIKNQLIYLAVPEAITKVDKNSKIATLLMASTVVPEGYDPTTSSVFYGVTAQDYIITDEAHYIALGDFAMAYKFLAKGVSYSYKNIFLPKTLTVGERNVPITHIHKYYITGLYYVSLYIPETVTTIPKPNRSSKAYGVSFLTSHTAKPQGWAEGWNEQYNEDSTTVNAYLPTTYGVTGVTETLKTYTIMVNGEVDETITAPFLGALPTPSVYNKYFWGWYDEMGNEVKLPYVGESITLYARFESEAIQDGKSEETAFKVTVGSYIPVEITTPGQTVYFKLTVTDQQTYTYKSRGNYDTVGKIYYLKNTVSNREQIVASADGGGSGDNFSMNATLSSRTYYFTAKMVDSSETGSFEIIISIA